MDRGTSVRHNTGLTTPDAPKHQLCQPKRRRPPRAWPPVWTHACAVKSRSFALWASTISAFNKPHPEYCPLVIQKRRSRRNRSRICWARYYCEDNFTVVLVCVDWLLVVNPIWILTDPLRRERSRRNRSQIIWARYYCEDNFAVMLVCVDWSLDDVCIRDFSTSLSDQGFCHIN